MPDVLPRAVNIARCPEHGLHGERDECFVCGGPVEQVRMVVVPTHPDGHPTWTRLDDEQKRWLNEVWDDTVVPALEEVDRMQKRVDEARLEAQAAHGLARRTQEHADARAIRERERRQELHAEITALKTRVLELELQAAGAPELAA